MIKKLKVEKDKLSQRNLKKYVIFLKRNKKEIPKNLVHLLSNYAQNYLPQTKLQSNIKKHERIKRKKGNSSLFVAKPQSTATILIKKKKTYSGDTPQGRKKPCKPNSGVRRVENVSLIMRQNKKKINGFLIPIKPVRKKVFFYSGVLGEAPDGVGSGKGVVNFRKRNDTSCKCCFINKSNTKELGNKNGGRVNSRSKYSVKKPKITEKSKKS